MTKPISVVSWNVNSIKARLEHVTDYLKRRKPSILCLQELKCVEEDFPKEHFESLGYSSAVVGQKTYNGVAVLTTLKIEETLCGFKDGGSGESARLIGVRLGKTWVYSVYAPNGQEVGSDKFREKLEFYKSLQALLEERHSKPEGLILAGDFNVAPEEVDVYDPAAWRGQILFSDRERKALRGLIEFGLADTYRKLHPSEKEFSWWDYRAGAFPRNHGLRIDLILASPKLLEGLESSGIDRDERRRDKPSDHAPVYSEFNSGIKLFAH